MESTTSPVDITTATPLQDILWLWLLDEPWRVVIVAGIPCILIILVSLAIACCITKRSKREYHSAPSRETADGEADWMGLPSVVNGALEMVTIVPSETMTVETVEEEAAHPATGEILNPQSFLGERDESIGPLVSPAGSPTDVDLADAECSLFPKPRSFKQHRTSSTSSQQKTLAYVEVELSPVTENKGVIISTEKPTEYAQIAGVYKPFSPK